MGLADGLGRPSRPSHQLARFTPKSWVPHCLLYTSLVDERALREIYLAAFEQAVREAQPWTVMGAYNKVNGTYACEHKRLLETILREEWGFQGAVISDWGAVNDPSLSLEAGLDLEMPASHRCV